MKAPKKTTTYVYSMCSSGRKRYLEQEHAAESRAEANAWIRERSRMGRPTHFMIVSSLDHRAATKRHCDGAQWDEAGCCYID